MEAIQLRTVSSWVVAAIGSAEAAWEAQLGSLRSRAEQVQDEIARTAPVEAYELNWSIGRYNIRPQTASAALDWALDKGIARDFGYDERPSDETIVHDVMDDERAAILVKAILAHLRDDHPILRTLPWDDIETSDRYIAKLYSGYLGAGGAWELWRASDIPGDEARLRLGCNDDATSCSVVQRIRPREGA